MAAAANSEKKEQSRAKKAEKGSSKDLKNEIQSLNSKVELLQVSSEKGELAQAELNTFRETFAALYDQGVIDS